MAINKRARPDWANEYLQFRAWSQGEFLNLLCGFPPISAEDTEPPPRARLLEEAKHRNRVERHVRDAIRAGDLIVEPSITTQTLLDKITPHLTDAAMLSDVNRAVVAAKLYSEAYHIQVTRAVRWAAAKKELFPGFPFTLEDIAPRESGRDVTPPARMLESLTAADPRTLGQKLDKYRLECGWSVEELAAKVGLDRSSTQRHLSDQVKPRPQHLRKYATAFSNELSLAEPLKVADLLG
jgi:hypothetical protein